MVEYGFINEGGYLTTRLFEESQVASLDPTVWFPVDAIDPNQIQASDDDHFIKLQPYINGNRISYRYNEVFDTQKIRNAIAEKEKALNDSDYKVIKCMEAQLVGATLPYDINQLHTERESLRTEINGLQATITMINA